MIQTDTDVGRLLLLALGIIVLFASLVASVRAALATGTDSLGQALAVLGVEAPRATISLQGREDRVFDDTFRVLVEAGMRVECDPARAWAEFQVRRVRYAPASSLLAIRLVYKRFAERP